MDRDFKEGSRPSSFLVRRTHRGNNPSAVLPFSFPPTDSDAPSDLRRSLLLQCCCRKEAEPETSPFFACCFPATSRLPPPLFLLPVRPLLCYARSLDGFRPALTLFSSSYATSSAPAHFPSPSTNGYFSSGELLLLPAITIFFLFFR